MGGGRDLHRRISQQRTKSIVSDERPLFGAEQLTALLAEKDELELAQGIAEIARGRHCFALGSSESAAATAAVSRQLLKNRRFSRTTNKRGLGRAHSMAAPPSHLSDRLHRLI